MQPDRRERVVCLLSGGLDSTTCLAIAKHRGFAPYCLSFDYGQRHAFELEAARRVASSLDSEEFRIIKVDLRAFGGSALTDSIDVPKDRSEAETARDIPLTYVPARNTIFLSLGLAYAEVIGATRIFIGVNALDYSGYPDCRPEFIEAFERLANLATKAGVEGSSVFRVEAPLLHMTKADIVRKAVELGVDVALTYSCYDPGPSGKPCGRCDSCLLRRKGFETAQVLDPVT